MSRLATFATAFLPLLAPASPIIATSGVVAPLVRRSLLCLSWLCRTGLHTANIVDRPILALSFPESHGCARAAARPKIPGPIAGTAQLELCEAGLGAAPSQAPSPELEAVEENGQEQTNGAAGAANG